MKLWRGNDSEDDDSDECCDCCDDESTVTVTKTSKHELTVERKAVTVVYMDDDEEPIRYDRYEDENGVRTYERVTDAEIGEKSCLGAPLVGWVKETETVARVVKANVRRFEDGETEEITFKDTREREVEKPVTHAVKELYEEYHER